MNRIQDYSKLQFDIDKWIKDYYYMHGIQSLVVGVSGGIDSAVVSTLCAQTGLPPMWFVCLLSLVIRTRDFLISMLNNWQKVMIM